MFYIIIMSSQQQLNNCFDELKSKRKLSDITTIINNYKPIFSPVLQSISLAFQTNPPQATNYNAFVPSADLLKTYQSTFEKANQNERIVNTTNYKLKANFSQSMPRRNRIEQSTASVAIADQPIMVEQKEKRIFQQIKDKQVMATIPNMEQTLFSNQLSNLNRKQVVVEHTLPLSEWKKIRNKIALQQK